MAKKLSASEIKLLQRAINDTNMQLGENRENIVHKASVILDYCQNPNKKEVCAKYDITPRTVQRWIEKFQLAGSEGRSEQEILLTLSDKPFKKSCYITEAEINQIIPDFSKNPIVYDLCYSVWDEFTVKEFLTKYHPSVSASPESIKKIIQACQMKYKNNFFDQNYDKIDAYKSLLDDQSSIYIYFHVYYLGSRQYRKIRKMKRRNVLKRVRIKRVGNFKQYYYGAFAQILNKDSCINDKYVEESSIKKIEYENFYQKILTKKANNPNKKYKIVTVSHKRERLAIQKLYNENKVGQNISFITIPAFVFNNLDNKYITIIQNVKSRIYSGLNKDTKNMSAFSLAEDPTVVFSNNCFNTISRYFQAIIDNEKINSLILVEQHKKHPM